MPIANVNGIDLYFEQHGSGPDLVLLSGLTATHEVWRFLIPLLEKHCRITVLDNRGVGQSSYADIEYSIELMALDVVSLMQHLAIEKAHVVGHSLGGLILQVLASQHPNCIIKGLFLCCNLIKSSAYGFHLSTVQGLEKDGVDEKKRLKSQVGFLFGADFLHDEAKLNEFISSSLSQVYPQKQEGLQGQLHALKKFDRLAALPSITAPVQALFADEDLIALSKNANILHQYNPRIDIDWIESCGHIPQLECPQLLARKIKQGFGIEN
mgnify:CR=1 FL=1